MSEMRRIQRETAFLADREAMMRDRRWIEDTVHASIKKSLQDVISLMQNANAEHGFDIVGKADGTVCIMRSGFVSLGVGWHQPIFNRVEDDQAGECLLRASEFSGTLTLPEERAWVMHQPKEIRRHKLKVDVSETRDLIWKEAGKKSIIPAGMLADHLVRMFLDLLSRANRGKVERPALLDICIYDAAAFIFVRSTNSRLSVFPTRLLSRC
jgi:hypothetical protein